MTYSQFIEEIMNMPIVQPNVPERQRKSMLLYTLDEIEFNPRHAIVEFGVFSASSINQIAKRRPNNTIYGFDSFVGLPEDWVRRDRTYKAGKDFHQNGILPKVEPNVCLISGWFKDTIPDFKQNILKDTPLGFVHIDCDIYSSTVDVLQGMKSNFHETVLLFDDIVNNPAWDDHEAKALYEFLQDSEFDYEWIGCYTKPRPASQLSRGLGMPHEAAAMKIFKKN